MHRNLHALDTSHMWVTRVNLKANQEPNELKKKRAPNKVLANLL